MRIRFEGGGHDGEERDLPDDVSWAHALNRIESEGGVPEDIEIPGAVLPLGNYVFDRRQNDVLIFRYVGD
jgi:hypothetical protein